MHIAIVTAGGAGMFCGSCMHDNTWAQALQQQGAEVTLIPTYTPIRVDEENFSQQQVFFGGINVYLDYCFPLWQKMPRSLVHWLDSPKIINLVTKLFVSNDAKNLGGLTCAMLQGAAGPQHHEVKELTQFLVNDLQPDVICFSNLLLSGIIPHLRKQYSGKIFATLQGDDVFLNDLPEQHRAQAVTLISQNAESCDGFLTHSLFYADAMSRYFRLPREKFQQLPLGINLDGHTGEVMPRGSDTFRVGYFARICPEKGLHRLIDAFLPLHDEYPQARLFAGGYLGERDQHYFRLQLKRVAHLGDHFQYIGSPISLEEKAAFISSCHVLSVPTEYEEPKGLYVWEALANGVPVIQPRHGAFSEMIAATSGGLLVEPNSATELTSQLKVLLEDDQHRQQLGRAGQTAIREQFNTQVMAEQTLKLFTSQLKSDDH